MGIGWQSLFNSIFNSFYYPMNNGDNVWELGYRVGQVGKIIGNWGSGWEKIGENVGNWGF